MEHSWEQLELMARAHRKRRLREILLLGQLIASSEGAEAWRSKQREIIDQINHG